MRSERRDWNDKYRSGTHAGLEPDPFLVHAYREFVHPLFPQSGIALDAAGGAGRHSIFLAERGWQVTLTDISDEGLALARRNAGPVAGKISFMLADLETAPLAASAYDLILVFFYLDRQLFPKLIESLRPGGLLLYKTYTDLHPHFGNGPTHPMHLLRSNELLRAFPGLTVLHYNETIHDRGVAEFVGQKKH